MDLRDQLKNLFPEHEEASEPEEDLQSDKEVNVFLQDEALSCMFEKRNGKIYTIIKGYNGADKDFKQLTSYLKKNCKVGGSFKREEIFIQGDNRVKIMELLKELGFKVKRVGG
ncbi:MAG: translation initiation factor [Flavobacteriaceae bacterium]|nr:translation initiation factor [Flavobacteriaceae bacterium]